MYPHTPFSDSHRSRTSWGRGYWGHGSDVSEAVQGVESGAVWGWKVGCREGERRERM